MNIVFKYIKIVLFVLILFILTEFFHVFYLPRAVNVEDLTRKVSCILQDKTGLSLSVENPQFKTYFDFSVSLGADKISVLNDKKRNVFSTENTFIRIQPFGLIFKELNLKEFRAKNVEFNVSELDKKLLEEFLKKDKDMLLDLKANNSKVETDGYRIYYYDEVRKKDIVLEGQTFDIKPVKRGLSCLTTDGIFKIGDKIARFNVNILSKFLFKKKFNFKDFSVTGNINGIELSAFEPYLNCFGKYENAKGEADIVFNSAFVDKNTNLSEINIKLKDISVNEGDFERQTIARGESKIKTKLRASGKMLEVEELAVDGDGFSLRGKGKVENYTSDKPYLDLALLLSPSKAVKILDLLPYGICQEINVVKKAGVSGDVSGALKIIGKIPEIRLFGNVEATNVVALRGKTNPHKGIIKLYFKDEEVYTDICVETPENQKFFMTGTGQIYDKKPSEFNIKTTEKLSGKLACDILIPVSQIFGFEIGPVSILSVDSGFGKANLHIKGTKKVADLNGKIEITKARGNFKDINAKLQTDLDLIFVGKDIFYKAKNSAVNGYTAFFDGKSTTLGDVDLKFGVKSADTQVVLNVLHTSPLLIDIDKAVQFIKKANGKVDFSVNLYGNVPVGGKKKALSRQEIIDNFKKLKTKGKIYLKNNTMYLADFKMPVSKVVGNAEFTENSLKAENLSAYCGTSKISVSINGEMPKDNSGVKAKIGISGKSVAIKDSLNFVLQSDLANGITMPKALVDTLNGRYDLALVVDAVNNDVDLKSVKAVLKFNPVSNISKMINFTGGNILIDKGNLFVDNLDITSEKSKLRAKGVVNRFYLNKPRYNLNLFGNNLSVKTITDIASGLTKPVGKIVKTCNKYDGSVNLNLKVSNNGADGHVNFRNLKFRHIKSDVPFNFAYLPIKITNNTILFDNISGNLGNTVQSPIFFKMLIKNYMKIPVVNGTVAIKPTSAFVERYLNTKMSHPVKVTGDIAINADINGSLDSLAIEPVIKLNKESDITYLSVNFGDTDLLRVIDGKIFVRGKNIVIPKIKYTKYPSAQGDKTYPMTVWEAGGEALCQGMVYIPKTAYFKTNYKMPAKILNFVFKKSLIKNGNLYCNLKYFDNGRKSVVTGVAEVEGIDVPMYNIKVKNGKVNMKNDYVYVSADGSLEEIKCETKAKIVNSLKMPMIIRDLQFKTAQMDLEKFVNRLNKWSIDAYMNTAMQTKVDMKVSDVVIEHGRIEAKHVAFKNAPIDDFAADFSLDKNSLLKMNTNGFKMSGGRLSGEISYNFKSGDTKTQLKMKDVDSNSTAEAYLGLKNQITGKLNGEAKITTKGFDDISRLKNLNGDISFEVADGNMPKLGSIEYLLRASNIIYSGLTTLSVNNLIELFKPFKQGAFENINGNLKLNNGVIKDIEVYSKGANMSLYINGKYDIENSDADVTIYGKLGKNIDNLMGAVGNLSANTILNIIPRTKEKSIYENDIKQIPEIEYKNQDVRIFRATVEGDINSSKAASSFKWLE